MRICILETDRPEGEFLEEHGTYADMFRRWLEPAMPEARFEPVHIAGGAAFPEDVQAYDGYLITGARAGVYDPEPWIAPLIAFLRRLRVERRPTAGICFGHQVMAQAFGGQVRKAESGWVIGRMAHAPTGEGARIFGTDPLWLMSMHQDQVVAPPPTAQLLVQNAQSPHGAFLYADFPAMSVQFHPEFGVRIMADLLDAFSGTLFRDDHAAAARTNLDGPLDSARVARAVAGVLQGA